MNVCFEKFDFGFGTVINFFFARTFVVKISELCGWRRSVDEMSRQGRVKSFWSGSQYDGEMLKGKRHGRGTKQWPNGDMYEVIRAQRHRKPAHADHIPACCICLGAVCVAQASGGSTRRMGGER